jgi:hypothetical protein
MVRESSRKFQLPQQLERWLATLSKVYRQAGRSDLQAIVVNAKPRVDEETAYDNWNGGTYGHSVYLTVPESVFPVVIDDLKATEETLRTDLNRVHRVQNEFFESVVLELDDAGLGDWRRESGLLESGLPMPAEDTTRRIWGEGFRVFLSHKSEVKKETALLKEALADFGISAFVAHQDIEPTEEWQREIEAALATMQGFVALLTPQFNESAWTDQEVGFAVCRGVPVVAVRMGRDPYGFIGRFQGLSADWKQAPTQIARLFLRHDEAFAAYGAALGKCKSWDQGNRMGTVLQDMPAMSGVRCQALLDVYNETEELRGAFRFNGGNRAFYGPGLVGHLRRWGRSGYLQGADGRIVPKS